MAMAMVATTQVTAAAAAAMAADTDCIRMAAMAATRDTRMAVSGTKNSGDAVRGQYLSIT